MSRHDAFALLPPPTALRSAVQRVFDQHPYSSSGAVDPTSSRVVAEATALWERLMQLSPAERIPAVCDLDPRSRSLLTATAISRLAHPACRAILLLLLSTHEVPDAARLAWWAWLDGDGAEGEFRALARPFLDGAHEARAMWASLLEASSPSQVVVKAWLNGQITFDAFVAQPSVALSEHAHFIGIAKQRLLRENIGALSARDLLGIEILQWAHTLLPTEQRHTWYRDFLEVTSAAEATRFRVTAWELEHAVCHAILDVAGKPSGEHAFWRGLSEVARDAFALWLTNRELTEYLGENDRVDFWRRYLARITRMVRTRDRQAVLIYLEDVTAVQFVDSGKKTFLFRPHAVKGWQFYPELRLYDAVRRLRGQGAKSGYLGDYDHMGYRETWQAKASQIVSRLL